MLRRLLLESIVAFVNCNKFQVWYILSSYLRQTTKTNHLGHIYLSHILTLTINVFMDLRFIWHLVHHSIAISCSIMILFNDSALPISLVFKLNLLIIKHLYGIILAPYMTYSRPHPTWSLNWIMLCHWIQCLLNLIFHLTCK